MGMSKHTPGPWEWWTSCSWKRLTSKDKNGNWLRQGNVLCPGVASDGHPVLDVSEADMALIAAAPDMLEALRYVETRCVSEAAYTHASIEDRKMRDLVVAAILKAEGGAS